MTGIVVSVEADEVAVQDTTQQLLSDGENPVDFGAGEGRVKEEADLNILLAVTDLLAQHLGEQHQVVVVHPDHVTVLNILDDCLGEEAVHLSIRAPGGFVEGNLTGMVVEEWP